MNPLGSSREIVQNKLIILHLVAGLELPVQSNSLTTIVLETRLMNYFMLQQCVNELKEGGLLQLAGGYVITASGRSSLQFFSHLIPPGIKKQLDKMAPDARRQLRDQSLVTADFMPESENEFVVTCRMGERDFPLLELKATVGTKKDARLICENWKSQSSEIYAGIMEMLINNNS